MAGGSTTLSRLPVLVAAWTAWLKPPKRSWGRYPSSGSLFPSPHPTLALAALSSPSPQAASCLHYLLGRSDMMALVAHGGWLDPHPSLLLS